MPNLTLRYVVNYIGDWFTKTFCHANAMQVFIKEYSISLRSWWSQNMANRRLMIGLCSEGCFSVVFFSPSQGQVCGLCGNFDGNSKNDFTTRSHETVTDVLKFGNSWKASSSCPDAKLVSDPCSSNPYRAAWSQKQCSIITSATFQSCHLKVTVFIANMHTYTHKFMPTHIHISFFLSLFFATQCSLTCVSKITPPAQSVGVLLLQ